MAHSDEDTLAGMEAERDERLVRAASFGAVADAYERARPGYPEDAVRWLAGDEPCDVVDLGAGTGKLTRSLVALGHRVTAVEPLEEMLDRLRVAVPGAIAVRGSAEEIPLTDGSADVVTCAQAFHWFDPAVALPEMARVLRRDGRIALVWNTRDDAQAWVAELTDTVIGRSEFRTGGVNATTDRVDESGHFGPVERASFSHVQLLGREDLVELVRSRSQCAVLSEAERAPVLEGVESLFDTHARDGVLAMPYVTECFRAVRR
ncbi:MAG: class I SAM-dependent methyltransferase [Gaiella sp.]